MTRKEFRKMKAKLNRKKHGKRAVIGLSIGCVVALSYTSTHFKDKPSAASSDAEYANRENILQGDNNPKPKIKDSIKEEKSFSRANEVAKVVSSGNKIISKLDEARKVTDSKTQTSVHNKEAFSANSSNYNVKSLFINDSKSGAKVTIQAPENSQINYSNSKTNNVFEEGKNRGVGDRDLMKVSNMKKYTSYLDKDKEIIVDKNNSKEEKKEMNLKQNFNQTLNQQESKSTNDVSDVSKLSVIKEFTGLLDGRYGDDTIELQSVSEDKKTVFHTKDEDMIQELASYKVSSLLTVRYSKDVNNYNEIKDVILRSNKTARYSREFEAFYAGKRENSVLLKNEETDSEAKEYKMSNYFAQENKDFLPDSKVWVVGVKRNNVFEVENIDELEKPKPKEMLIQSRPTTVVKKVEEPKVGTLKADTSKITVVKSNNEELKEPEAENVLVPQQEVVEKANNEAETSTSSTSLKEEQQPQNITKTEEQVTKSTEEPIVENPKAPVEAAIAVQTEKQDVITNSSESITDAPTVEIQEETTK
ncbi:hypothetical protein [Priestia aryabhattai]